MPRTGFAGLCDGRRPKGGSRRRFSPRSGVMIRDLGHIHGDVAPLSHGDTQVGLCQGRAVVDPVADHRPPCALRPAGGGYRRPSRPAGHRLAGRYPCFGCYGTCRRFVVARQQPHVKPHGSELRDGLCGARPDPVGDGGNAYCFAPFGEPDDGLRRRGQPIRFPQQVRWRGDARFPPAAACCLPGTSALPPRPSPRARAGSRNPK